MKMSGNPKCIVIFSFTRITDILEQKVLPNEQRVKTHSDNVKPTNTPPCTTSSHRKPTVISGTSGTYITTGPPIQNRASGHETHPHLSQSESNFSVKSRSALSPDSFTAVTISFTAASCCNATSWEVRLAIRCNSSGASAC